MSVIKEYTDQELLNMLKCDSQAAFTTLYNLYSDSVYLTARRMLDDEEICFDIVQDIFEWLWINRSSVEIRSFKSYLTSAARFKVLNHIKKGKFTDQLINALSDTSEDFESLDLTYEVKELQDFIKRFTSELPEQARKIFHLSRNENLTNKEIAEQMSISESTVKKQINISLKKLRLKLGRKAHLLFLLP